MPDRPVTLVQSLPGPLDHYCDALSAVFVELGFEVRHDNRIDVQRPGRGLPRLIAGYLKRAMTRSGGLTVVLWPSFGLLEPLLWLRRRSEVLLIIHDATPLRQQRGYGRLAALAGALAVRLGVPIVTHSPAASEALVRRGWPPLPVVPLPIAGTPEPGPAPSREGVRVLGQFKPSRDLEALAQIAAGDSGQSLAVVGRGWPSVRGWDHVDDFVPDTEFARLIAASRAIVIPYRHVWQSDVAVQALESLTPVVCLPSPGVRLTWGDDWPGYVDGNDWLGALERALLVQSAALRERRSAARDRSLRAWQEWLSAERT